jgi:tripartite-type tricarboxylate transporter receptor subunit TctC
MLIGRRKAMKLTVAGAACMVTGLAKAQAPMPAGKVLTLVVPYPPGASTDQVARLLAQHWPAVTGQTLVIENKGGANGNLGAAVVAKSPPDGSRILLATQPIVSINPFVYKDAGFDASKDLTPLTCGVNAVVALVCHPSLPVSSMAELIDYGKRHPGELQYGTAGSGSPQHVGGLLLAQRAGISLTHVPYRGGGPMVSDLLAGHIKLGIVTLAVVKGHLADKRLKILAIGEKSRFAGMPEIPTIAETLPGFELTTWLGFFGPHGLPRERANALSQTLTQVLNIDEVKAQLQQMGLPLRTEGPEALARLVQSDQDLYGRIIRDNRITAE